MVASAVSAPDQEQVDLALLTGPQAQGLLAAVLAAEGVELVDWATHQVHHRPGVGVTVGFTVSWRAPGARGEEYLLATTAPVPTGSARVRPGVGDVPAPITSVLVGDRTVHVWRHPADPALPALPLASSVEQVARLLGVGTHEIGLDLVTYRPLRRAVLRARTPVSTVYLKVVRPHTAEQLDLRHRLLLEAGLPVAPSTVHPDGLLVLGGLPGVPLTDVLAADGAWQVAPEHVTALLDRLPGAVLDLPRRPSWPDLLDHHTAAAAAAVPDRAVEIETLGRAAAALISASDAGPVVPTHGDLHDANLLIAGGRVIGLLDVDSVGPGHRVDDIACLLGHLSVLPALAPEVHRRVPAALARWTVALERGLDPVALRARAAAVALSLVAGARRDDGRAWTFDADCRLAAVRRWLDEADRLRGLSSSRPSPLIHVDQAR